MSVFDRDDLIYSEGQMSSKREYLKQIGWRYRWAIRRICDVESGNIYEIRKWDNMLIEDCESYQFYKCFSFENIVHDNDPNGEKKYSQFDMDVMDKQIDKYIIKYKFAVNKLNDIDFPRIVRDSLNPDKFIRLNLFEYEDTHYNDSDDLF
jgi:hypothetical protein